MTIVTQTNIDLCVSSYFLVRRTTFAHLTRSLRRLRQDDRNISGIEIQIMFRGEFIQPLAVREDMHAPLASGDNALKSATTGRELPFATSKTSH